MSKVHVTFLVDKPDADRVAAIDPSKFEPDEFEVIGREVHLHCPNGYGRSKLNNAFFEKKLAQRARPGTGGRSPPWPRWPAPDGAAAGANW